MISRLALFTATAALGAVAFGATALAHIEPDPAEAQAGDTLTVGFTVEHGCDGSPTIEIEMRLADGVTNATPEPLDGWDESIDDDVVTFTGGSLDPETEGTFEVTMTMPPTPDATIWFPFVQRCEVGEIRWIGIPDEPGDELDEPAPAMNLIGPVVATTAPPSTTSPSTTSPSAGPVATEPVTSEAAAATTVAPVATTDPEIATPDDSVPAATSVPESTDEDGSSDTGTIIFIVSVLAVALVGAFAYVAARRTRSDDDTSADGAAQ